MIGSSEKIMSALGPLARLYADPDVLEIMVDAPERVLVENKGCLEGTEVRFDSAEEIRAVIDALMALNGAGAQPGRIDPIDALSGGEARALAVLPPTAIHGPCLVIRKLMNVDWISWEKLVEWGSISQEALECLRRAVRAPVNILMAGGTASGKTTVANRIAELIAPEQRLVVVEHHHELQIHHPRALYLEAAGQPGVSLADLIGAGVRMRPDWLVFGELVGPEALNALQVMGQGCSGMTTLHANSLQDALLRLESLCLMAKAGLGLPEIRNLIAGAIQLVCYQKHMPDGRRRIIEMAEVRGVENGQLILVGLFRYDPETDQLEATGNKPAWE